MGFIPVEFECGRLEKGCFGRCLKRVLPIVLAFKSYGMVYYRLGESNLSDNIKKEPGSYVQVVVSFCAVAVSAIVCFTNWQYQKFQVELEKAKFNQNIQDTYFQKRIDFMYKIFEIKNNFD